MDRIIENDKAIANIDLMFAIVLVMGVVAMAILIMPTLSHEDREWRIRQYMTATRATDNLVQDAGSPLNWETKWNSNYSNVSKLGFLHVDTDGNANKKVLNLTKIKALMGEGYIDETNITGNDTIGTNTTWWEYPSYSTSREEKANATRALGLEGYNFYMRLYPVGLDRFNYSRLEINITNRSKVSMNENTASVVDRYVYINSSDASCKGGFVCYEYKTVHYRLNLWVW